MAEYWICLAIFLLLVAAAYAGRFATSRLPARYVDDQTKESVKRVTAFLLTLSALLLGLLISTGKSAFDKQSEAVANLSSTIAHLDQLLAHYGPDADPTRRELKQSARQVLLSLWAGPVTQAAFSEGNRGQNERYFDDLLSLHPTNEAQALIKAQAVAVANTMIEQGFKLATMQHSVSTPLVLGVIVGWLTVIFASLGFCSSANVVAGIRGIYRRLRGFGGRSPDPGVRPTFRRAVADIPAILDVALAALGS